MRNRLAEIVPSSVTVATEDIVIEPTLAGKARELIERIAFDRKHLLIVCDSRTHAALGKRLMHELGPLKPQLLLLEGNPLPDDKTVAAIRTYSTEAIIAVGSGTLNDACKYASFLGDKPYAVFPTAPSMNGYLSANASIIINGHKHSVAAHMPKAVFCDLSVLADAPKRLIQSGLGDSLCRPTAQADWLLSHLIWQTPYTPFPFEFLKPYEHELFTHSDKLLTKDMRVIELLLRTLLVSGIGMVIAAGSYPASQGEHLIAHTLEMKWGKKLPASYHGEQIGVTTLTMAKIQEEVLARPLTLTNRPHWEKTIASYFGSALAKQITESSVNKYRLLEHVDEARERLQKNESEIRETLRQATLPEAYLREVLKKAGARTTPDELGIKERDYELVVSHARFVRDRFTFLDML